MSVWLWMCRGVITVDHQHIFSHHLVQFLSSLEAKERLYPVLFLMCILALFFLCHTVDLVIVCVNKSH